MRIEQNALNYGLVELAMEDLQSDIAMRMAQPLLDGADPSTQWFVGRTLHRDAEVRGDMALALEWYGKAAAQGFPRAVEDMRIIRERGKHWYAEESRWGLKASNAGVRFECSDEAVAFESLPSCSRMDCARALKWYRNAAGGIDPELKIIMGLFYENGIYVRKNGREALSWYRSAVMEGSEEAHRRFKALHGDLTKHFEYDMRDIANQENHANVVGCSLRRLGIPPKDITEALRWYLKLAEEGDADAQYKVSALYSGDHGIPRDQTKYLMWLKLASERHPDQTRRQELTEYFDDMKHMQSSHMLKVVEKLTSGWVAKNPSEEGAA